MACAHPEAVATEQDDLRNGNHLTGRNPQNLSEHYRDSRPCVGWGGLRYYAAMSIEGVLWPAEIGGS